MANKTASDDVVFVRSTDYTYIARWRGKQAACSASPMIAAQRAAEKVLRDQKFHLERLKSDYAWRVIKNEC